MGQSETSSVAAWMSVYTPEPEVMKRMRDVRDVPISDIRAYERPIDFAPALSYSSARESVIMERRLAAILAVRAVIIQSHITSSDRHKRMVTPPDAKLEKSRAIA